MLPYAHACGELLCFVLGAWLCSETNKKCATCKRELELPQAPPPAEMHRGDNE